MMRPMMRQIPGADDVCRPPLRLSARASSEPRRWPKIAVAFALCALSPIAAFGGADAADTAAADAMHTTRTAPARRPVRRDRARSLHDRVQLVAAELDLNADQQAAVRSILAAQREQLRRVWSDAAVPAAYRIAANKRIGEQTGDRIRAVLTEAQRRKYQAAKPAGDAAIAVSRRGVDHWMNATNTNPLPRGRR
jgi:hypothetical protein